MDDTTGVAGAGVAGADDAARTFVPLAALEQATTLNNPKQYALRDRQTDRNL